MARLELRVTALENGERLVNRNERDPQLVTELTTIYGDRFRLEMVPMGISALQFWRRVLAEVAGKPGSRGIDLVKRNEVRHAGR